LTRNYLTTLGAGPEDEEDERQMRALKAVVNAVEESEI